jgi:hypothetical protein
MSVNDDGPIYLTEALKLTGMTPKCIGTAKHHRRMSTEAARECRTKYWLKKATQEELAAEYNVSLPTISHVIHRKGAYAND